MSKGHCPLGSQNMPNDCPEARNASATWSPKLVYGLAAICVGLGILVGYLVRGSAGVPAPLPAEARQAEVHASVSEGHPAPTLEQMKRLADTKAAPLLAELKKNPRDKKALTQTAYIYRSAHQFQDAATYLGKALEVDPRDVTIRTEMASCLYYGGDADGAIAQLHQSLKYDPKDANALFNLGMIRWKGKNDPVGAVAAWQELLRTNPNLDRKTIVEQMIAEAKQGVAR